MGVELGEGSIQPSSLWRKAPRSSVGHGTTTRHYGVCLTMGAAASAALFLVNFLRAGTWKTRTQAPALLLLAWMWVLIWSATDKPDYGAYLKRYERTRYVVEGPDIGHAFTSHLAAKAGLSYDAYLAIVSAIALTLIVVTVLRYTDNLSYVLVAYFAFPFFFDAIQVRNFLAFSIVFFGLRYLARGNRFDTLKFLLCVVIAASFHTVSLAYLVFLVPSLLKRRALVQLLALLIPGMLALALINPAAFAQLAELLTPEETGDRAAFYLVSIRLGGGFLLQSGLQIFALFVTSRAAAAVETSELPLTGRDAERARLLRLSVWWLAMMLPLTSTYLFNSSFWRVSRNTLLITYLAAAASRGLSGRATWKRSHVTGLVIILVLLNFVFQQLPVWDRVVMDPLQSNLLSTSH